MQEWIQMEQKAMEQVVALAEKKYKNFKHHRLEALLRAMMASMFIGFGVIVAFKTGSFFYNEGSPFAYPMAALTFGTAIVLIYFGGGDLFTGNTFYFTTAALRKQISWVETIKFWAFSWIGNLLGAILFAFIIWGTGLFQTKEINGFLMHVVEAKMHAPTLQLLFRGILCNWLVCLAFFIPMTIQGDGAKIATMLLFVFGFFISGYEHSIANMSSFAVALVNPHPMAITLEGFLHNMIPVTIGNIIGGGLFMGVVYSYFNRASKKDVAA
jgi:nitrite transporter NirC